jgi:hypothetical protein
MRGRPRSSTRFWADSVPSADAKQLTPQLRRLGFTKSGSDPLPIPSATVNFGSQPVQVKLVATTPNFGGRRYWYLCPHCGQRVRKLYEADGTSFPACRTCLGLQYESQYRKDAESAFWRQVRRWSAR